MMPILADVESGAPAAQAEAEAPALGPKAPKKGKTSTAWDGMCT